MLIHLPPHNCIVPRRSSKDHDFMTVGRNAVEQIIGEKLSGEPLDDPNAGKNPAAVARLMKSQTDTLPHLRIPDSAILTDDTVTTCTAAAQYLEH